MAGRGYTIFDTSVGRCGIAWGDSGIIGVRLPEAREMETRRRLLQAFPDARDLRPPPDVDTSIDAIVALLRGESADITAARLDMSGVPPFHCRVFEALRMIPRGETRSHAEIARRLGVSGAIHAVAQAVSRNPFAILVPCHRAVEAPGHTGGLAGNAGTVTRFRLLSLEGALTGRGPTLMDALFAVAPPRPQS